MRDEGKEDGSLHVQTHMVHELADEHDTGIARIAVHIHSLGVAMVGCP